MLNKSIFINEQFLTTLVKTASNLVGREEMISDQKDSIIVLCQDGVGLVTSVQLANVLDGCGQPEMDRSPGE